MHKTKLALIFCALVALIAASGCASFPLWVSPNNGVPVQSPRKCNNGWDQGFPCYSLPTLSPTLLPSPTPTTTLPQPANSCQQGFEACSNNCPRVVREDISNSSFTNTNANELCQNGCDQGLEDCHINGCGTFKNACRNSCAATLNDFSSGRKIISSSAMVSCEWACASGEAACSN